MKVKELIEELKKHNQEMIVAVRDFEEESVSLVKSVFVDVKGVDQSYCKGAHPFDWNKKLKDVIEILVIGG